MTSFLLGKSWLVLLRRVLHLGLILGRRDFHDVSLPRERSVPLLGWNLSYVRVSSDW